MTFTTEQQIFEYLDTIEHFKYNVRNRTIRKWSFFVDEHLYIIRHTTEYQINNFKQPSCWSYATDGNFEETLHDIVTFVQTHKHHIDQMNSNYKQNTELVEKLCEVAKYSAYASDEYIWNFTNVQVKFFIYALKDTSQKTIKFIAKNKTTFVDKKTLLKFVEKNKSKLTPSINDKVQQVNKQLEQLTIIPNKIEVPCTELPITETLSNLQLNTTNKYSSLIQKHKNLFVRHPKWKRIQYQTCKPFKSAEQIYVDEQLEKN